MTTECYYRQCPFHSSNKGDDGPYCDEPECLATPRKCEEWQAERDAELQAHALPPDPKE